jgi:hypothetical protein
MNKRNDFGFAMLPRHSAQVWIFDSRNKSGNKNVGTEAEFSFSQSKHPKSKTATGWSFRQSPAVSGGQSYQVKIRGECQVSGIRGGREGQ